MACTGTQATQRAAIIIHPDTLKNSPNSIKFFVYHEFSHIIHDDNTRIPCETHDINRGSHCFSMDFSKFLVCLAAIATSYLASSLYKR